MLIPTVKEVPAEAEITSHKLMIRAGLIRKVASGTYTYLPLGWRTLKKIIHIVREEMDRAGAQEIIVPCLQPLELWHQTGRDVDYGETMFRLKDRHGRWNVLGPTAEEVFTFHAGAELNSYKQLPVNLYQITPKFRDEFRPRFGVLRSREFIMKDAYSFDADAGSLHKSYMAMYNAYCRVFQRCGVEYVIVEAESGEMGGSGSHQFTVPCESGEDTIVYTTDGYAANLEKAEVDRPPKEPAPGTIPPAENVFTPNVGTIEAVCGFLKTRPQDMIKTLIFDARGEPLAALVRGDHEINPEKLTQAVGGLHIELATPEVIERVTGAKVGFAGPMGLASRASRMVIDYAVAAMAVGVTGANKTDHHTRNVVPGRDFRSKETTSSWPIFAWPSRAIRTRASPYCSRRASRSGRSSSSAPSTARSWAPCSRTKPGSRSPVSWAATASASTGSWPPRSSCTTTRTGSSGPFRLRRSR
jgi:prolyl-tRNA synthetase